MQVSDARSSCPISTSLDIFGDRWSLLIVRDLMLYKTRTYGDFAKSAEGIATNILANRLQLLEDHGIILKMPYPDNKVKGLYQLTPKGIDLVPALIEIALWGQKHLAKTDKTSPFLQAAGKNKAKFLKKVMGELGEA